MKDVLKETLIKVDNVYGVSGDEEAVAKVISEEMQGLYDEYFEDVLGNQYYIRHGRNRDKKFVLTAHMDEIGFAVSYVEDDGKARLMPVGFHDDRMAVDQRLVAITKKGLVYGVTGNIPFHFLSPEDMEKPIKISDLCLDFGTSCREETNALGVDVGDYVAFEARGEMLNGGDVYCGKSVDNRACCAVLIDLMRRLKDEPPEITVCTVFTVQEEVGMRAGGPVATRLKPDLFIGLDCTLARGFPGIEKSVCHTEMNEGVCINYFDWDAELGMTGNNVPKKVTRYFEKVVEENNIPYQKVTLTGGGTDSWSAAIAGEGTLCGGIFIPTQYVHSAVGIININDMISTEKMLLEITKSFPF